MTTKTPLIVWEPATHRQIQRLAWSALDGTGLPAAYRNPLPDPKDIHALSKQEASWLIERSEGPARYPTPRTSRTLESLVKEWGRKSNPAKLEQKKAQWLALPTGPQMWQIRELIIRLGWKRDRYADYLHRQAKVRRLRELNRKGATAVYLGLTEILKARYQ